MSKLQNILKDLRLDNCCINLLDVIEEDQSLNQMRASIDRAINEYCIVGCRQAMEYLTNNDYSLSESLELAKVGGYTIDDISTELLANLLMQDELREVFATTADDIFTALCDYDYEDGIA